MYGYDRNGIDRGEAEDIARRAADDVRYDVGRQVEDERSARQSADREIWDAIESLREWQHSHDT